MLCCGVATPIGRKPSISFSSAIARLLAWPNLVLRAIGRGIRGLLLLEGGRIGGDLSPCSVTEASRKMFAIWVLWLGLAVDRDRLGRCLLFRPLFGVVC